MLHTRTSVNLYTGLTLRFPRKRTRFEQMSRIANNLRVSPELFKYSALFCSDSFYLPYSKKHIDSHVKGTFYYRFVSNLLDLEDTAHHCPEVFSYIYHQAVHDFISISSPFENKQVFCQIVAVKLAVLGVFHVSVSLLDHVFNIMSFKTLNVDDFVEDVTKSLSICKRSITSVKCDLIRRINEINSWIGRVYDCILHNAPASIEITRTELKFTNSDSEVIINVKLSKIDKVQFNFKQFSAVVSLTENSPNRTELNLLSRSNLESFLTVLDIAYKVECPGDQILDHKLADDLNTESLVYHDPEFIVQSSRDDKEAVSHFNYSLVDRCSMVLKVEDKTEAERILRFSGNRTKFLVTKPFLPKEHSKVLNQYLFFIILGDRFIASKIDVKGGRFKIDDQQQYLSLIKLFNQIKLMDKKGGVGQKHEFVDHITEENVMKLSEYNTIYNSKLKGEPSFSSLNVELTPLPLDSHYLYTHHHGVLHAPQGKTISVTVTQFITHNTDYGSYILLPLITQMKSMRTHGVYHENLVKILGVYRVNYLPCVVEERFGVPLNFHVRTKEHSVKQLYEFGKQIVAGLLYLHEKRIIHGYPALHNIHIVNKHVKLGFIGILPELVKCRDVYNSLLLRDYVPSECPSFTHPARWLHRSMIFSNAPWNIEIDRLGMC